MIEENRSVGRYGKYRVESGVDVEEQGLRSSAVRLASNPLVAELLLEQNLKWYGASREREGLDIKIVAKTERDSELIGMNGLFGQKKCVGIAFARESESYEDVMERLRKNSWLNNHLEQGAEVAVLGVTKMDNWCEYYEQIREDGWEEMLGRKSLDCSGLDVMNESRVSGLWSAMDGLVRRDWDGWAKVMEGAGRPAQMSAELEPEGSKFDVVFVDRKDEKGSVWMHNVRVSKGMKGQLLEEEVLSEPVRVFGWVVRKPGENMREAYHRAENLRRYWKGRAENGDRVEVPVVSDGQLSLWRKLSSVEKVEAGVEVELTVDEVIKYLYLGKSNLGPGPFSQAGLSLPGRAREMHGTDIIFYGRNDENEREYVAVPNMVCWDMAKLRRGKEELVALNNVGGIIILPDEMDPSEMSRRMREAAMMYNRTTRGKKKNILILTPKLFLKWQEMDAAVWDDDASLIEGMPELQKARYGYGSNEGDKRHELRIFQRMPGIGGNKLFIIEESDNQKNGVWVDFGKDFGKSRPFPQRAASATGIWTQLERGQIPLVPGNYDMWYILRTVIGNMGVIQDPEHVVASYLRAEVIAREMEEELTQLMGWQQVQLLLELGKKDIEKWYGGKSKRVESAIFTHPHADHIGDAPYLDRDQEWFGLEEMFAHMKAVTARAGAWDSGYEFVSRTYEKRRGGAYERSYRNWSPVGKSGELMNVSPGLVAEMGLVNHSIGGAGMVGISTIGGKPLMLATGDYKMGEMTMRTAERLAGKYPLIVTESTNALRWEKPSQNVSVEMVERTMFDLVGRFDGQGLTIITPPNHLERLEIILDVAEKTGRKVALGPEMAEVVHQLFVARENLVADASEGFNQRLPIIGEDVGLWWRPITSPRKYNKLLKSVAEQRSLGVVDSGRLSQESGDWIVVETPYRTLGDSFAQVYFPNGMQVLHSSYYPYENDMQRMVMDNTNWLRERVGGHYHTDFMVSGAMGRRVGLGHNYQVGFPGEYGLHSSGHASFEEAFGILTTLTNGWQAGQKLALIHGEHPMSYYRSLVDKIAGMGGHQPEVVWQMNRYDVASRKLGGHVIRLGE